MKKEHINTIFLILVLVGGIVINVFRFFPDIGIGKPEFEVFDVRTFNDLEPATIVHYQLKNVGRATAHDVLTSVSTVGGNGTSPAFFQTISRGEAVSVNRNIPLGNYEELRIGVLSKELKAKYYTVKPDAKPDPPPTPDFIVYNLTITTTSEDNQTINMASFGIMNIGGSAAHNVDLSLEGGSNSSIPLITQGEAKMISIELRTITWKGVGVKVSCNEGIIQTYYLIEYR